MVPAFFEVAFGGMKSAAKDPASREEPLELTRGTFVGEETIKISGQIDRVDLARDDTLVAYDYKLSTRVKPRRHHFRKKFADSDLPRSFGEVDSS